MQLEDGAHLDVVLTEPVGLGFHVVDVDRRHAAVLRLLLGECDLHRSALELGPAAGLVEVRLLEAELARVPLARSVEVADAVPNPHSWTLVPLRAMNAGL